MKDTQDLRYRSFVQVKCHICTHWGIKTECNTEHANCSAWLRCPLKSVSLILCRFLIMTSPYTSMYKHSEINSEDEVIWTRSNTQTLLHSDAPFQWVQIQHLLSTTFKRPTPTVKKMQLYRSRIFQMAKQITMYVSLILTLGVNDPHFVMIAQ